MIILGLPWESSVDAATWLLFLSSFSIAFSDVIVDSLMVIQARRFPKDGCEELNTFSWACMSFGGIIGSIIAAVLTENSDPRHCFTFSSVMGLMIAITATRLSVSIETSDDPDAD